MADLLARHGFVAAAEEARELVTGAGGDRAVLDAMVRRRLRGEPLAWITGSVAFCGQTVRVDPGVYVPRWQSEPLAERAAERLPATGAAVDLCTGSGALAMVLGVARPGARVVASELDGRALACARANGVEVYGGDLFAPLPAELAGAVDVVVGVVPYVPSAALALLPRDTLAFEGPFAYDGGPDGLEVVRRVVAGAVAWLRPGGALLLEVGGDQAPVLTEVLGARGYEDVEVRRDDDGDVRAVEATLAGARHRRPGTAPVVPT